MLNVDVVIVLLADTMLQHDGLHGLLRCVTIVLTSITLRVHFAGRDQAVGDASPY